MHIKARLKIRFERGNFRVFNVDEPTTRPVQEQIHSSAPAELQDLPASHSSFDICFRRHSTFKYEPEVNKPDGGAKNTRCTNGLTASYHYHYRHYHYHYHYH